MAKKRVTPEDDFTRLAEKIWTMGRSNITNRTDFNSVYDSFMSDVGHSDKMKDKVFEKIQQKHKTVKDVRGRNKARSQVFKQFGEQPVRSKKQGIKFNTLALQGKHGKVVWARKTRVKIRGKERVVLRDSKGQFVKAKQ